MIIVERICSSILNNLKKLIVKTDDLNTFNRDEERPTPFTETRIWISF